jgi:hypothetical protein
MNGRLDFLISYAYATGENGELNLHKFADLIMQECIDNLYFHGHIEASEQVEWFKQKLLQKNNSNNG